MAFLKQLLSAALDTPIDLLISLAISLAIFLVALVLNRVYDKTVHKLMMGLSEKMKSNLLKTLAEAFRKPVKIFILALGVYIAVISLFDAPFMTVALLGSRAFLKKLLRIMLIITFVWGLSESSDGIVSSFRGFQNKLDMGMDKSIAAFVTKLLKVIIIAFGVVIIIAELGYDVNGLIAGIGLGGLTFALAAQDTASNFFGGVVILLDKPFSVDDWIQTPSIEGVVEDISFRSTSIRTFSNSLIVVPNSKLSNEPITNWSKMYKRRVQTTIGLTYNTPKETLETITKEIKEMLSAHPEVNKESIVVNFNEFSASSLDIFIQYFTTPTALEAHMQAKQDINFKIMEIVHHNGAGFAFPSTSLYIEKQ